MVGLLLITPILFLAHHLDQFARRVSAAKRFPPPGQAATRDTPILEGRPAVRRARIIQVLASLLASPRPESRSHSGISVEQSASSLGAFVMQAWFLPEPSYNVR